MTSSNHNSTPSRRRVPSPPALPPDSELIAPHILVEGDKPEDFLKLRAQTHDFANHPTGYASFLADLLASQSWEFARDSTLRSAALNLQIADNRESLDREFDFLDDPTRQYLAWQKLAADPAFRALLSDSDRLFRRLRQAQDSILKASARRR
jgi:hypothetical protein